MWFVIRLGHINFSFNMVSFSEKTDMLLIYGECLKNSRNAARLYAERYPDRPDRYHPPHNFFVRIEMSLREHGQFTSRAGNGRRNQRPHEANDDEEMQVLAYININPRSSVRHLAKELNYPWEKCTRF